MNDILQSFLAVMSNYEPMLVEYGLVVILAAIAIEGFGIPAPGQSLLIAGALLSTRGEFDISLLLASAWIATIVGSAIGYVIGRVGGRKLLLHLPLRPSRLERMETFCQRYGTLLVIVSRFIDGPRQLTGIIVGSLKMPAIPFLVATSAGALLWVGFWGVGSYYVGQHMHIINQALGSIAPYTWVATGLLVLVIGAYLLRKHNHRKSTDGRH
ncbi:MAG: DedA family protein [Gammaproteobacteria bacterium]|nr:DedA family protein [Gammaproteobacteria bacterium]